MSALPVNSRARTVVGRTGVRSARTPKFVQTAPRDVEFADPLAEVSPWGGEGTGVDGRIARIGDASGFGNGSDVALSDMVDRAGAQLLILRRTLDEASAVNRQSRQRAGELTQRLEAEQELVAEIDERLAAAEGASGTLDKAARTLRALEQLVGQIRGASAAIEQRVSTKLAEQGAAFERRIAEMSAKFEARLDEVLEQTTGVDSRLEQSGRQIERREKSSR